MKRTLSLIISIISILSSVPSQAKERVEFYWSDSGTRHYVGTIPESQPNAFSNTFWKGERAYCEAVISADSNLNGVTVKVTDLKSGQNLIPSSAVRVQFELPVLGDAFTDEYCQCGERDSLTIPRIKVFDILDISESADVKAGRYQPVWFTVNVPQNAAAGTYKGTVTLYSNDNKKMASLPLEVKVADHLLPAPYDWKFHLDLWQNPYSVARYHGVELWSKEHFELMKPVMEVLAAAGQKVITTTITNTPWHGQTHDPFASMVAKVKCADGSWIYDYSAFDKWVEFMIGLGIDKQISCYSLVTWASEFDYFDSASTTHKHIFLKPGTEEYNAFWTPFIKDFAKHLREKGWFERTCLAMDERGLEDMLAVARLIREIEPGFKLSLAGFLHNEVEADLHDLCVTFHSEFPSDIIDRRRAEGKVSTVYTCCSEKFPNTFTASQPAEAAWLPVYAIKNNYDGYLRWAYNSWTTDPMKDTRHRLYGAGDCFIAYPEGRSSVRLDKLIEGIQLFEKIRILKEGGMSEQSLEQLNEAFEAFTHQNLYDHGAKAALDMIKNTIDTIQ